MATKISLISADGQKFEVDIDVAKMSQTIKDMVDDIGEGEDVPLPNVTARILAKVIEYCTEHVKGTRSKEEQPGNVSKIDEELKTWDAEFCKVDQGTLFELILAANYLNMKSLLELTCQTVASMIKGKTPEEIRATFNIEKDFTKEEEEEVKRENSWAFS